jgi:hypothetical protein
MLSVQLNKIRPGREAELRSWLAELTRRREEVVETFRHEGVRHEQAFILEAKEGPLLLYVMELEDPERAREVYRASQLPIDLEHRRVMADVLGGHVDLVPIHDCAVDDDS